MKIWAFSILLLVAFSTASSQSKTFNKLLLSYSGTTAINSFVKDNLYKYCLFLQVDTPNNQYQQYGIMKFDTNFLMIDSSLVDIEKGVISTWGQGFELSGIDSSFIFTGTVWDNPLNSIYRGYIVKFDKNLDTLWTKQIAHPDTAYADTCQTPWVVLTDVKVTPEGNYLIAGNYNHHCQGERNRSFIIKMEPNGEILWQKFYDPTVVVKPFQTIELDFSDTGFYFVSVNNNKWSLFKANKEGIIVWTIPFTNNPCFNTNSIKIVNNNIYVAARFLIPVTLPSSNAALTLSCIDKQTHALIWNKDFRYNSVYSIFLRGETISIEPTPGGNIAIGMPGLRPAGNDQFLSGNRGFLLLLSPNGDSLWSRYYTYYSDDPNTEVLLHDMVICDDGGFLFGGTFFNPQYDPIFFKAWLVKTDSNGMAPMSFTVSVEEETLIVKRNPPVLYPVPASDQLNIRFQESQAYQLMIEVFDLNGQRVFEEKPSSFDTEYRINIQNLPSGMYMIRLTTGKELLLNYKFVKR